MAGTNIKAAVTSAYSAREVDEDGLIITAIGTGAPATTAGVFIHGAEFIRTDSGTNNPSLYENVGTTASPSWNLVGAVTPGEITLARGFVLVGNSSGVAAAVDANDSGKILVGDGTDLNSVSVSGNATLAANGALTVTSLNSVASAKNSVFVKAQGAPTAKTTSSTMTAADLIAGIVTINQGAAGASAQQLPTAADLDTALPAFAAGDSFDVSFINTSTVDAEDASVTTNTGWTLVGAMDFLAYNAAGVRSSGILRLRKTGAGAWVAYRIA